MKNCAGANRDYKLLTEREGCKEINIYNCFTHTQYIYVGIRTNILEYLNKEGKYISRS